MAPFILIEGEANEFDDKEVNQIANEFDDKEVNQIVERVNIDDIQKELATFTQCYKENESYGGKKTKILGDLR